MNSMTKIERATNLALVGHHKQRRNNEPYINHPLRIAGLAKYFYNEQTTLYTDIQVISILHDLIEDTEFNYQTLNLLGICSHSSIVKMSIETLTYDKTKFESKDAYFKNILESSNTIAIFIKFLDAIDNSQWTAKQESTKYCWKEKRNYYRSNVINLCDKLKCNFSHIHEFNTKLDNLMFIVQKSWYELDLMSTHYNFDGSIDLNSYIYDSFMCIYDKK